MIVLPLFILSTLNLVLGLLRILVLIHHDVVGFGAVEQLGQDWLNIVLKVSPSHFSITLYFPLWSLRKSPDNSCRLRTSEFQFLQQNFLSSHSLYSSIQSPPSSPL